MTTMQQVRQAAYRFPRVQAPGELGSISMLTPKVDLTLERRTWVQEEALRQTRELALQYPSLRGTVLTARMLNGVDLGLTRYGFNETVTATVGGDNTTYENSAINATTANDRAIGIYGVYLASSRDSIGSLRFVVGGKRTHQWDLQQVIADPDQILRMSPEQRTLYAFSTFDGRLDPVLIPPNTVILVQHYVRSGTAVGIQPSEIVYLGVVVEGVGGGGGELVPRVQ